MEERYRVAFNILPNVEWEEIAVIQLQKKITKFDQIICINIKGYNETFIEENKKFTNLVLSELNIIRRS